jgi:N-glycosylase/DNA lyase
MGESVTAVVAFERPRGRPVTLEITGERITFDWGYEDEIGSAAFWIGQASRFRSGSRIALGETLAEEVVACLLGGHGVPAAVGLAAYDSLRAQVDLRSTPSPATVTWALQRPLHVSGRAHLVRYRFPRQRGERISRALARLSSERPPSAPLELREWLLRFDGIGPKTASWIVRNHTGSDAVAIIDIHIQRAGVAAGFFDARWQVTRNYDRFEQAFLAVAQRGGVRASVLDACIWYELQRLGRNARLLLQQVA